MLGAVILQIILIALNAVFACAEIAVLSMSDVKLESMSKEGDRSAKRADGSDEESGEVPFHHTGGHYVSRLFGKCICLREFCTGMCKLVDWTGSDNSGEDFKDDLRLCDHIDHFLFQYRLWRTDPQESGNEENRICFPGPFRDSYRGGAGFQTHCMDSDHFY